MLFSERNKLTHIDEIIHVDDLPIDLERALGNSLFKITELLYQYTEFSNVLFVNIANIFANDFLIELLNLPPIEFRHFSKISLCHFLVSKLKEEDELNESWYIYYDAIEFFLKWLITNGIYNKQVLFDETFEFINEKMAKYNSGFRMSENLEFVPITDEISINAIASTQETIFEQARNHIRKALNSLRDKESPDYNSVIRESINAVESCLKELVDNESVTLGGAIRELKNNHPNIDTEFLQPFNEIYGRISNDGIRHANGSAENVKHANDAEAILILTTCSALINYLSNQYKSVQTAK